MSEAIAGVQTARHQPGRRIGLRGVRSAVRRRDRGDARRARSRAQDAWKRVPLAERAAICRRMTDLMVERADDHRRRS